MLKQTLAALRTPSADPSALKRRRIVWTGAIALITIVGAVTGAQLKMDRDVVKGKRRFLETPVDDRIAMLEERRAALVRQKRPLDAKLAEVRARIRAEEQEAEAEGRPGE